MSGPNVQVVASDTLVAATFERECFTFNPDADYEFKLPEQAAAVVRRKEGAIHRKCVADEHYVATVLAANGLDEQVTSNIDSRQTCFVEESAPFFQHQMRLRTPHSLLD